MGQGDTGSRPAPQPHIWTPHRCQDLPGPAHAVLGIGHPNTLWLPDRLWGLEGDRAHGTQEPRTARTPKASVSQDRQ